MSTDSDYTSYGYEYLTSFDGQEMMVIVPQVALGGLLEFTEQDLLDMLAELRNKKESSK